ncbi:hypothetical protein T265_16043, partial [Opisthorchis viverrini]
LETLSVQQLVDCSHEGANEGCNGGDAPNAFKYVKNNGGLQLDQDYPYISNITDVPNPQCAYDRSKRAVQITGHVILPYFDEDALLQAVGFYGPVAVSFDARHTSFDDYK